MNLKVLAVVSSIAVLGALNVTAAQAGGIKGSGNGIGNLADYSVSGKGKVHINQNGNGCRNRCYISGDVTNNAGWNNGNEVDVDVDYNDRGNGHGKGKGKGKGKGHGYGKW